ncbi:MAG: hypothetical protein AAFU85_22640 [Planctomycetota bacterium]
MPRSIQTRRAQRTGFTLVELLIVGAIATTTVSLLLPAVQKMRESTNEALARSYCVHLAQEVHAYRQAHGQMPPPISSESDFWAMQAVVADAAITDEGSILLAGHQLQYAGDGDQFTILCDPVEPGLTGSQAMTVLGSAAKTPSDDDLVATPIPQADVNREAALTKIQVETWTTVATLLDRDDAAAKAIPSISALDAFDALDANVDGELTMDEICGSTQSVIPASLAARIRHHLRIGAGGETIATTPGIRRAETHGSE